MSELAPLHEKVKAFGKAVGLSPKCLFEIDLALEEIVANIISYGLSKTEDQGIHVTMTHDGEKVVIQIEDCGQPFDPNQAQTPDLECTLEEARVGGLGIHLVKRMMNDVQYQRCGDKNVVIIEKKIS